MTTVCRSCGAEVVADAAYCHRCGQPVQAAGAPEPVRGEQPAAPGGDVPSIEPVAAPAVAPPSGSEPTASDLQRTLWQGGYCAKSVLAGWIVAALVTVGAAVAGATSGGAQAMFLGLLAAVISFGGIGLYVMYRKLGAHYQLTAQRFVHQAGVLHRVTDRIEVIDVDDVAYYQGPLQRLIDVGTIKIISSDASHAELFLEGIDHVARVAQLIDDARRAERQRRGLFIEAV